MFYSKTSTTTYVLHHCSFTSTYVHSLAIEEGIEA